MTTPAMYYQWDGDAMVPRSPRAADEHFVIGQYYRLVEEEERSEVSHRHEFAWLNEAWKNLPEQLVPLYPSVEHLRKRALISAGLYNERIIDAGSNVVAIRIAAVARDYDEFALISVADNMVIIRSAKSQSRKAMNKAQFQDSKTKILEIVADLIGVQPEQLASDYVRQPANAPVREVA
jgi:hypothetical protein